MPVQDEDDFQYSKKINIDCCCLLIAGNFRDHEGNQSCPAGLSVFCFVFFVSLFFFFVVVFHIFQFKPSLDQLSNWKRANKI